MRQEQQTRFSSEGRPEFGFRALRLESSRQLMLPAEARGRNRRQGQILIVFAMTMPILLSMSGLVFDGGRLFWEKRMMQFAADAAAKAGAHEVLNGKDTWVDSAAKDDTALNGFDNADADITVTVNNPPNPIGVYNNNFVEVIISKQVPATFMRMFGVTSSTVSARAVAGVVPAGDPPCVLALNPTMNGALTISGGAQLNANCRVMVNSNSAASITQNGSGACVTASSIGYVNDAGYINNGSLCLSPMPAGQAIAELDPYKYLAEPDLATAPVRSNRMLTLPPGNQVLQPGRYIGGIKTHPAGTHVKMLPGTYIVDGYVQTSGSLTGTGVTLYNTAAGMIIKSSRSLGTLSLTFPRRRAGHTRTSRCSTVEVCPTTIYMTSL